MTPTVKSVSLAFALCLAVLVGVSCRSVPKTVPSGVQTGLASWYGPNFHGKKTSNREVYNMYDMTAAHRTLPFGTYVMVTNLNNGRSVKVRINDRGPFVKERIIDLSYAAARVLDAVGPGVVPVKIEVLADESPAQSPVSFAVQVGSFINKENASSLQKKLKGEYQDVYVSVFRTLTQTFYRVRIKAPHREDAESIAASLNRKGYVAFVVEEF